MEITYDEVWMKKLLYVGKISFVNEYICQTHVIAWYESCMIMWEGMNQRMSFMPNIAFGWIPRMIMRKE